nr:hypothetical protein [Tanacetum cinerariifolium]
DLEDSLIMRDEDLSTILEKESDQVIKSSVENFASIQSESEDTSGSDNEYDLSSCDDFSPIDVPDGNPDANSLFVEVLEDIESKVSYDSNLDEPDLLVTPFSDTNEDECFDLRGDIDEINAFLEIDVSTDIKDGYYDLEGDIIYLENLLTYDTIPSLISEMFLDHDPKGLKDEPNDDDLKVNTFTPNHTKTKEENKMKNLREKVKQKQNGYIHKRKENEKQHPSPCVYIMIKNKNFYEASIADDIFCGL